MTGKRGPLSERFWSKVDRRGDDECWAWMANKNNKGYGMISPGDGGSKRLAHRMSWQLANGTIPVGLCVLHKCDNPPCVNPSHLFLGTYQDNAIDKVAKGRAVYNPAIGERHPQAVYTEAEVVELRRRLAAGERVRVLAREIGRPASGIRRIREGTSWAHLSSGPIVQKLKPFRGGDHSNSVLDERSVVAIKIGLAEGARNKDLAAKYGVATSTICDIRQGRTWGWLKPMVYSS